MGLFGRISDFLFDPEVDEQEDPKDYENFRCGGARNIGSGEIAPYLKKTYKGDGIEYGVDLTKDITVTRWTLVGGASRRGPGGFYYDAPEAFLLAHDGSALACIAFEIDTKNSSVCIKQIQGEYGRGKRLSFLKWERFLVDVVTNWAVEIGFRKALIQPAVRNKYWCHDGCHDDRKGLRARLRMRYDVTAKRTGFRYDKDAEHFAKAL